MSQPASRARSRVADRLRSITSVPREVESESGLEPDSVDVCRHGTHTEVGVGPVRSDINDGEAVATNVQRVARVRHNHGPPPWVYVSEWNYVRTVPTESRSNR